jgi:hypothetical protein
VLLQDLVLVEPRQRCQGSEDQPREASHLLAKGTEAGEGDEGDVIKYDMLLEKEHVSGSLALILQVVGACSQRCAEQSPTLYLRLLTHSGYYSRVSYTGWLINHRFFFFLQFWRLGSPKPKCWWLWCLVKAHFLVHRQLCPCYVFTQWRE